MKNRLKLMVSFSLHVIHFLVFYLRKGILFWSWTYMAVTKQTKG